MRRFRKQANVINLDCYNCNRSIEIPVEGNWLRGTCPYCGYEYNELWHTPEYGSRRSFKNKGGLKMRRIKRSEKLFGIAHRQEGMFTPEIIYSEGEVAKKWYDEYAYGVDSLNYVIVDSDGIMYEAGIDDGGYFLNKLGSFKKKSDAYDLADAFNSEKLVVMDYLLDYMDCRKLLEEMVRGLSDDAAFDLFDFIMRMHNIPYPDEEEF